MRRLDDWMLLVVVVVSLAIGVGRISHASEGRGCFPAEYLQTLQQISNYNMLWSDGSWDVFVCDDVASETQLMGVSDFPNILTNQVWKELHCEDLVIKVWVVNCNEA